VELAPVMALGGVPSTLARSIVRNNSGSSNVSAGANGVRCANCNANPRIRILLT
jgi:hypothetical protein